MKIQPFYDKAFLEIANPIISTEAFISQKKEVAHGKYSVYDHCIRVAILSYSYAKNKKLRLDYQALVRGALLHDFYLYDWHERATRPSLHGFKHPFIAFKNANKLFSLSWKEKNIIHSHMFPFVLFPLPLSKEAWIVSRMDKIAAYREHETLDKTPK